MTDRRDQPSTDVLAAKLVHINTAVDKVLEQTILTNGRVDRLESWRDRMTGAWLVVTFLSPVVAGLIVGLVLGR
jgi:hypothetical protein